MSSQQPAPDHISDLASICEDVAGLLVRGDWQRARRSAEAALASTSWKSPGAVGGKSCDCAMVRWLASVQARGAWEGGCLTECAIALQLARGLEVSAAHERRALMSQCNECMVDIEEEAYSTALQGNQLCCSVALALQCGKIDQNFLPGMHEPAGAALKTEDRAGEKWSVARLTLKKHLYELGCLVKACARRTVDLLEKGSPRDDMKGSMWPNGTLQVAHS